MENRKECWRAPERGQSVTLQIRCGCEGGGKGALIQYDKAPTLNCGVSQIVLFRFKEIIANEI